MLLSEVRVDPFEFDPGFDDCLEAVFSELKQSISLGRERHGDGFAMLGLQGFATHCWRKAKDQYRLIVDRIEVGDSLEGVSRDLATYAILERAFLEMAKRKRVLEGGSFSLPTPRVLEDVP